MTDDPFAEFNAGIQRARREYEAHPFSRWNYAGGCICEPCQHARTYARNYWRTHYGKAAR